MYQVTLADTPTDGKLQVVLAFQVSGHQHKELNSWRMATYTDGLHNCSRNCGQRKITNSYVTASSPGKTNDVTDTSDDGDDTDGNTTNDATVVEITASPAIEVTKTAIMD